MQTVIGIIIALIIFSIIVSFHEFGHFIVAKRCGVTVTEFSIGMGPRLLSHVAKSGTRYSLKLLPLGGSCSMLGEDEDNSEEGSFNSKSVWARMAILFAGPFFNFILAFVFSLVVIGIAGSDINYVTEVDADSAAYSAGLREGDKILKYNGSAASTGREFYIDVFDDEVDGTEIKLVIKRDGEKQTITYTPDAVTGYLIGITYTADDSDAEISYVTDGGAFETAGGAEGDIITSINGTDISSGNDLYEYMDANNVDGSTMEMVILRDGEEISLSVDPVETESYYLGFSYNTSREKQSIFNTVKYSIIEMRYQVKTVVISLKKIVTGQVSSNDVSGPVGIVSLISDTYTETMVYGLLTTVLTLINLTILLSSNLGVMNLLPIPALDGGRILFCLIEIVTRKPIPRDKEGFVHFIGFVLLMILMVYLFYNDIRKLL